MLLRARIGSLALALGPAGAFLAPHSRPGVIGAGSPALRHALAPHHSISLPVHRPRPARLGAGVAMQAEGIVLAAGVVDAVQAQLSALTLDDIAGGLFAVSLFPYLGFLYHLGRPENKTPELGLFGFKFLLAFVAASIPAAIAAKVLYGAQLADVDYLHGGAESFLALTNLFIVLGFRRAVAGTPGYKDPPVQEMLSSPVATAGALAGALFLAAQGLPGSMLALAGAHAEPANALSFPTWMVHTSSLIEWLTAMGLVWRYADVSGNPRWKGLTWGMLPFHSSGLCACTYHVFYNAPPVAGLVALQSLLTVVGDMTCWYAAYRIFEFARDNPSSTSAGALPVGWQAAADPATGATYYFSDTGETTWDVARISAKGAAPQVAAGAGGLESEVAYFGKLTALCIAASALVKWGELQLDFPFEPTYPAAFALIGVPTALNILTWIQRSRATDSNFNEFY